LKDFGVLKAFQLYLLAAALDLVRILVRSLPRNNKNVEVFDQYLDGLIS
jgi:hypothetical protein